MTWVPGRQHATLAGPYFERLLIDQPAAPPHPQLVPAPAQLADDRRVLPGLDRVGSSVDRHDHGEHHHVHHDLACLRADALGDLPEEPSAQDAGPNTPGDPGQYPFVGHTAPPIRPAAG